MVTWTLHDGTQITEAQLLRMAADAVMVGVGPIEAVLRVWQGPAPVGGRFGATQLVRGCTPWLPHVTATDTDVAAAMRARADFLDTPHEPCPRCGHPNGRHDGRPCLPTSTRTPCLDCRYAHPAEPTVDDPDCE